MKLRSNLSTFLKTSAADAFGYKCLYLTEVSFEWSSHPEARSKEDEDFHQFATLKEGT